MNFSNVFFAIWNWADEDAVSSSSTTSNGIGTGSKTWTVSSNTRFYVGVPILIYQTSNTDNWMIGTITDFNIGTGRTVINVTDSNGSGTTITDWTLVIDKWSLGSWQPSLPLDNLIDNRLYKPARTTDATIDSTRLRCDFSDTMSLNAICGVAHNLSENSLKWIRLAKINDLRADAARSNTSATVLDWAGIEAAYNAQTSLEIVLDNPTNFFKDEEIVIYSNGTKLRVFWGTVTAKTSNSQNSKIWVKPKWLGFSSLTGQSTTTWTIKSISNWNVVHDSAMDKVWPLITLPSGLPWGTWPWEGRLLLGDDYKPPFIYMLREQFTVYAVSKRLNFSEISIGTKEYKVSDVSNFSLKQSVSIYSYSDHQKAMSGKITSINTNTSEITVQTTHVLGSGDIWDIVITGTKANGSFTPVQARFLDIYFDDTSNSDGFIEIGRLVASSGFQPEINMAYGSSVAFVDESRIQRSRGGQFFSDIVPVYRQFKINLEYVKTQDMLSNFYEMQRRGGTFKPVLIILNPDDAINLHRYTLYGSLDKTTDMPWTEGGSDEPYMSVSLTFNEWIAE